MDRGRAGPLKHCVVVSELLSLGGLLEPLVDPKPGGVTRCSSWKNNDIYDFVLASIALRQGLRESCIAGCVAGCLAKGIREYLSWMDRLGVRGNINSGTLILMIPLACTWPYSSPVGHAKAASACIKGLGRTDAYWYYRMLEHLSPSHLGEYEGPIPSVGSGEYPEDMMSVLRAASWDLVHRELLFGYPVTLEALAWIRENGASEESVARLIVELLSKHGDTLIARSRGWRAYYRALADAKLAVLLAGRYGFVEVVRHVRRQWAQYEWTPGAILDVVATGLGLYYLYGSHALV